MGRSAFEPVGPVLTHIQYSLRVFHWKIGSKAAGHLGILKAEGAGGRVGCSKAHPHGHMAPRWPSMVTHSEG